MAGMAVVVARDMTFSDDDLKRLKEDMRESKIKFTPSFPDRVAKQFPALLARLEAAENVFTSKAFGMVAYKRRYKVWLKAAGKE
jgi:hypothetical protein